MNRKEKSLTLVLSGFLVLAAIMIAELIGAEISSSDLGVAIVIFIFLLLAGIFVYAFTPKEQTGPKKCKQCGAINPKDAQYCERCGFYQY